MLASECEPDPLLGVVQVQRVLLEHGFPQHQVVLSVELLDVEDHEFGLVVQHQLLEVQADGGGFAEVEG